jgi:hypothetical protein
MFTLFWFLFFCNNINSYFYFYPKIGTFLQKKTFTRIYDTISIINNNANENTTMYNNNNTVKIQRFIENIKLFEYNEMEELWDSGEIEWEV